MCIECLGSCWFLRIQSENKGCQISEGFMNENDCKLISSRTISAEEQTWGRSHRRWCLSFIHSFIHRVDVDFPAWIKHCLKPLGYVRKQDGQNPGSQELTLQQRRQRENSYHVYVCVYKVDDENKKKKKTKQKGEKKKWGDQNSDFNNDQPVPSEEAYLSRGANEMRGNAHKYLRNEYSRIKSQKLQRPCYGFSCVRPGFSHWSPKPPYVRLWLH